MTAPLYRNNLPQLSGTKLLSDGGLETTLIFHDGFELPLFAAYVLLEDEKGRAGLRDYYRRYLAVASKAGSGLMLEAPTWRCSKGWGKRLGHDADAISRLNRDAVAMMAELRAEAQSSSPIVVSGCIGPSGDAYSPETQMTGEESEAYHGDQIRVFADSDADMVTAMTMTHTGEAIGIARAAKAAGIPVSISFTVETDGALPSGQSLREAIEEVEDATGGSPAYYMINCAHPDHFADVLKNDRDGWTNRIYGVRANASRKSHAELDESETLDDGNPVELGRDYLSLARSLPNLAVFGGCCGTDHRHVRAIAQYCCQ